jgi:hypothetical protein
MTEKLVLLTIQNGDHFYQEKTEGIPVVWFKVYEMMHKGSTSFVSSDVLDFLVDRPVILTIGMANDNRSCEDVVNDMYKRIGEGPSRSNSHTDDRTYYGARFTDLNRIPMIMADPVFKEANTYLAKMKKGK